MDDRIVVPAEQTGQLLVECADLLIDELQFLQEHLQQPAIDRL
jgi:hypothetical protein